MDGFNLYYRALQGTPYRWLNLLASSQFPVTLQDAHGQFSKPSGW